MSTVADPIVQVENLSLECAGAQILEDVSFTVRAPVRHPDRGHDPR
jgi:ABC-type molybdenum transport system ATPase subunit/photorepair protein PhrA